MRTVQDSSSAMGSGGASGFNRLNQSLTVFRADGKNTFAHFHARAFLLFPYARNMLQHALTGIVGEHTE